MPELRHVDPYEAHGPFYLWFCRVANTRLGAWLSQTIAWKLDPHLFRLTGGRLRSTGPIASALLETRGARTGHPRRVVTLYFHDKDLVTIIASKRGLPHNPAWYYNLVKHPDVIFGGRQFRAHIVEDESERERLWALADRVFPPFSEYRKDAARAGRVIPIVQLVPRQTHRRVN